MSRDSERIADEAVRLLADAGTWTDLATLLRGIATALGRLRLTEKFGDEAIEELRGLVEDGVLLRRPVPRKPEMDEYICRNAFFEGKRFLASLTQFEQQQRILMTGHRFVPFVHPEVAPNEATLLFRGKPLPLKQVSLHIHDSSLYCTLLGKLGWLEYLSLLDDDGETIAALESNALIQFPAYDLSAVLAQSGDATVFVLQCVDYDNGVVELVGTRRKDAPVDFAGTNAACRALDASLTAVFDDWGPEFFVLPEQIAMAYARLPESFFTEPPLHFGGYLSMSTTVAVAESFMDTVLWRKGQDPRDAVDPDERQIIETMVDGLRRMHEKNSGAPEWPSLDGEPKRRRVGRGKRGASHGTRVLTLRVALEGRRGVSRDIEIHEDNTWCDLHETIFDAFDREEEHLYAFYLTRKACPDAWKRRRSPTIGPHMDGDEVAGQADPERTTFGDSALLPKDKLYYLFDFGDEWWHALTVTRIDERPEADPGSYPRIVKAVGDSPPQYPCPDEE